VGAYHVNVTLTLFHKRLLTIAKRTENHIVTMSCCRLASLRFTDSIRNQGDAVYLDHAENRW
jgi:hypothetical protein